MMSLIEEWGRNRYNIWDSYLMTIGFREILVILGIVGVMIWMRMVRTSMEENTAHFFRKLKGPQGDGNGFGWRGLLIAFLVGIGLCCGFAFVVLRIWVFYHPVATALP